MHKKTRLALLVVAAVSLTLAIGAKAQAWTQFKSGNNATVAAGETVDSSLWIGAKNIDIAGTVNGDVICGAQTVNISGTVKGDVICGAQTITISGSVEGGVRLGAQTINLNGSIGHSAIMAAQTINTDSKSQIGGDASLAGSDITLNGSIGRDLSAAGANVNLNGRIGRDVKSNASKITLARSADVGGGIDYTSKDKIGIASGAVVVGDVTQHLPKAKHHALPQLLFFSGVVAISFGLVLLVSAVILTALLPQLVHRVSTQAIKQPWRVVLTGFVASIIIPMLAVLLMVTVVGVPLGLLLLLGWTVVAVTSGLFSAYYVGRRLWAGQQNALLRVLAGSAILLLLYMVPYLGFFVMLAAFWMGAGMVLLELKDRTPRPKYQLK